MFKISPICLEIGNTLHGGLMTILWEIDSPTYPFVSTWHAHGDDCNWSVLCSLLPYDKFQFTWGWNLIFSSLPTATEYLKVTKKWQKRSSNMKILLKIRSIITVEKKNKKEVWACWRIIFFNVYWKVYIAIYLNTTWNTEEIMMVYMRRRNFA